MVILTIDTSIDNTLFLMVDAFLHELNDNKIIYIPNGTEGMCLAGNIHSQLKDHAQGEYKKEFEDEEVSIGIDVGNDEWGTIVSKSGMSPRFFIGDPIKARRLMKIRMFLHLHFTREGRKFSKYLKEFDE